MSPLTDRSLHPSSRPLDPPFPSPSSSLSPQLWRSTFPSTLFSDSSLLAGLMFLGCFLTLSPSSLFYNIFKPHHRLDTFLFLSLFTCLWTFPAPVSSLSSPRRLSWIIVALRALPCLRIYLLFFPLFLCVFRHCITFSPCTGLMHYDSTLAKFAISYEFGWAYKYHIEIKIIKKIEFLHVEKWGKKFKYKNLHWLRSIFFISKIFSIK